MRRWTLLLLLLLCTIGACSQGEIVPVKTSPHRDPEGRTHMAPGVAYVWTQGRLAPLLHKPNAHGEDK